MQEIRGRVPTIPEYYKMFINSHVDLDSEPKQCCPFHKEDTPSFSYSRERDVWRCFGSCKCGGDVYRLHQKNYNLRTLEEAKKSLNKMFDVYERQTTEVADLRMLVNPDSIALEKLLQRAIVLANTPDRWIELDYVMSCYPVETTELGELINKWKQTESYI